MDSGKHWAKVKGIEKAKQPQSKVESEMREELQLNELKS